MTATIYSEKDSADVANAVGQYVLKAQTDALKASDLFKIALSGGSLGKVLKKALIDNSDIAPHIKWDKWDVYFSDERIVPLDHEDSNYGLFNDMVLKNLPEKSPQPEVHTIDASLITGKDGQIEGSDPAKDLEIAREYALQLPEDLKFDLILLGCGPDGHTCSLFPRHNLLCERTETISFIANSPKPPPRRITFTFPVLEKATNIAFVAEGAGKAAILKEIFTDATTSLPCARVNKLPHPQTVWFTDKSAVEGVNVDTKHYQ